MTRALTLILTCLVLAPFSHAGMSQEQIEQFRSECLAVDTSGSYGSVDNKNAAQKCLSACSEDINIYNNRHTALCYGAYNNFKKSIAEKFDKPITRVTATVDYTQQLGWKLISTNNAQVSKHCDRITLAAAKTYPAPLKGHQMMIANLNEVPVGAVETPAVLINLRIKHDNQQAKRCTAEVVYLRCPAHKADFTYCNP